jgi:hypothetical protein
LLFKLTARVKVGVFSVLFHHHVMKALTKVDIGFLDFRISLAKHMQ